MCHVCVIDSLRARREALVLALRPLLGDAEVLDPDTSRAIAIPHITSDAIALIGLPDVSDDADLDVIRRFCERGCTILVYAHGWDRAPVSLRSRVLLAGATAVLDSSHADFDADLGRRLALAVLKSDQRREDERRLSETMTTLGIVGQSAAMLSLGRWILKVGPLSDLPVLVTGQTGTGKELIAHAIHALDPKRCRGPFVPLNCAALTVSLAESELFGHRKGAFTGASQDRRGLIRSANGGTLFLDEIGDLDLGLQAKFLRVLQEDRVRGVGEDHEASVNVRVVAATNRELPELVDQGRFRMDLFYRLNLLTARAPALSERGNDIEVLARHFVQKYGGGRTLWMAPSLLSALRALKLPGNVRQLENLIRHAVVLAQERGTLGIEDLPASVWDQLSRDPHHEGEPPPQDWAAVLDSNSWSLSRSLLTCERHFVKAALQRSHGNQSATARLLGITPRSVYNKIRKHRLAR